MDRTHIVLFRVYGIHFHLKPHCLTDWWQVISTVTVFSFQNSAEWWMECFFIFHIFVFHHMISHFPLVVFGKFCIYLSTVMGGNCRDVVPFSLTHPIYSWFGNECRGCGQHREGKMGQICTIFRNPHTGSPHKNSQYSRQAVVRTMWVSRRWEEWKETL